MSRLSEEEMTLNQLKPGQRGTVSAISGEGTLRQRLMDMGVMPNTLISLRRKAPTGQPIWIEIGGTELALRKAEAELIAIEVTE